MRLNYFLERDAAVWDMEGGIGGTGSFGLGPLPHFVEVEER